MSAGLLKIVLRGIIGIASLFMVLAAAMLRGSSNLEGKAKSRLRQLTGDEIGAIEQECWDREKRTDQEQKAV